MRLCIIENGLIPEELQEAFGSYPAMIESWLAPALPEADFTYVSAVRGEALPEATAFDGYLLTGSRHSCYEHSPWMLHLTALLRRLRSLRRPVFGICFGHQIMADAFDGRTTRAEVGWGVGAQAYHYDAEGLEDAATLVFHQDQVSSLPPQARVAGGSAHCPHGVLEYAFPARSVQFHPEFSVDYLAALLDRYGNGLLPADVTARAWESLQRLSPDNRQIARWAAAFFREHARPVCSPFIP